MTEKLHIKTTLFRLQKNRPARICGFHSENKDKLIRLREIGFAEGDLVEIMQVGLFGRSPLNVKLHGTSIAMRPDEARMIEVIPADLHRDMGIGTGTSKKENKPCCGACGDE